MNVYSIQNDGWSDASTSNTRLSGNWNLKHFWIKIRKSHNLVWSFYCVFFFPFSVIASSIVGTTSRYPFADRWKVYIHIRSTFSGHSSSAFRRLDTADKISTASWFRHIRMSGDSNRTKFMSLCCCQCFALATNYQIAVIQSVGIVSSVCNNSVEHLLEAVQNHFSDSDCNHFQTPTTKIGSVVIIIFSSWSI